MNGDFDFDGDLPDMDDDDLFSGGDTLNGRSNFQDLQTFLRDTLIFGQQLEAVIRSDDTEPPAMLLAIEAHPQVVELSRAITVALEAYAGLN